jgi:hypothetical protein
VGGAVVAAVLAVSGTDFSASLGALGFATPRGVGRDSEDFSSGILLGVDSADFSTRGREGCEAAAFEEVPGSEDFYP